MPRKRTSSPNPNRVAAGKKNRLKRKGLSDEGRQKLREAAIVNRPWRFATGPRTPEGKARAAANGKKWQKGEQSVQELRAEVADIQALIQSLRQTQISYANRNDPT